MAAITLSTRLSFVFYVMEDTSAMMKIVCKVCLFEKVDKTVVCGNSEEEDVVRL